MRTRADGGQNEDHPFPLEPFFDQINYFARAFTNLALDGPVAERATSPLAAEGTRAENCREMECYCAPALNRQPSAMPITSRMAQDLKSDNRAIFQQRAFRRQRFILGFVEAREASALRA